MVAKTNRIRKRIDFSSFIDPDVLWIFDVDAVLFDPVDAILQTRHAKIAENFENTIDTHFSKNEADGLYSILWQQRQIQHIDKDMLCFVRCLQAQNLKILALTHGMSGHFGYIQSVEDWRIQDL